MEIGVAEPLVEDDKAVDAKGKQRSGGGSNTPGKGGGGGSNNGGDSGGGSMPPDNRHQSAQETPDKAKVVTWFLLLVVLMTFGGLIGAYVVIATNGVAEWKPFSLPIQVWVSTVIIIVSSFFYHLAQKSIFANDHKASQRWLLVTSILGAAFVSSQLLAWLALVDRGLYMSGNPYAGFFYILTGIHAAHVIGGIVALGAIYLRAKTQTEYGPELKYRRNLARSVGWYWHFMGAIWIVLFVMLGFWK